MRIYDSTGRLCRIVPEAGDGITLADGKASVVTQDAIDADLATKADLGGDGFVDDAALPNILKYFGTQAAPAAVATWTARGTAFESAIDSANGGIFAHRNAQAGHNIAMLTKAVPGGGGDFAVDMAIIPFMFNYTAPYVGMCLYESATGKIITNGWVRPGGYVVDKFTSNTVKSGTSQFYEAWCPMIHFLRIARVGTNYVYSVSFDGTNYLTITTKALTDFFTTAADEVGFFCNSNQATTPTAIRVLSVKGL